MVPRPGRQAGLLEEASAESADLISWQPHARKVALIRAEFSGRPPRLVVWRWQTAKIRLGQIARLDELANAAAASFDDQNIQESAGLPCRDRFIARRRLE